MMSGEDAITLGIFTSRLNAICEDMGSLLCRAALSSNIKDRQDYSCAIFDTEGALSAQAAHIPVHLGSMAYALAAIVAAQDWQRGEMVILNDPFLGGTHLPDVTLIAPVFYQERLQGFVANRAHHAAIGAVTPGSMPLSTMLSEEGVIIPPTAIGQAGSLQPQDLVSILGDAWSEELAADLMAQASANRKGIEQLLALIETQGEQTYHDQLTALNNYAERLARKALMLLPAGRYTFSDRMDDDGQGQEDIVITVSLAIDKGQVHADFGGSSPQVRGNINCPLPVTAAALFYVFRCLMPEQLPACAGSLRPLTLTAPEGSLVNARQPAAVTAGNVETSSRIVDVLLGALAEKIPEIIPAASQGTMNNIAMGGVDLSGHQWDYYETLAGGMGAHAQGDGLSAVHSHMTNTRNTPIEVLEMNFPLRCRRYALRTDSGGQGQFRGGDGLLREYEILADTTVTMLSERRRYQPWGLAGGDCGQPGRNRINGRTVAGKFSRCCHAGDMLTIETPGGGGWGKAT